MGKKVQKVAVLWYIRSDFGIIPNMHSWVKN